ncbi:unnamed protein product [Scytosiphon promiscuus]
MHILSLSTLCSALPVAFATTPEAGVRQQNQDRGIMFKFDFYQPATEAEKQQGQPSLLEESDHQHVARRVETGVMEAAHRPAQAVAWHSGEHLLVRAIPSPDACPEAPEESDLVPGIYEGGLKVWEASLDLVEHLFSSSSSGVSSSSTGVVRKGGDGGCDGGSDIFGGSLDGDQEAAATGQRHSGSVLELGCGHGFPGIVALQRGCRVCFSDFNREVIEQVTIPNVRLNVEERYWPLAEFYSGDWTSLSPLLKERDGSGLFNLILTAETLYTTEVADKVLSMVLKHLAPGGQALVASKRFYFGTGGSTKHFRDEVAATRRLVCSNAVVVDTGKGNIREILRVSWARTEAGVGAENGCDAFVAADAEVKAAR